LHDTRIATLGLLVALACARAPARSGGETAGAEEIFSAAELQRRGAAPVRALLASGDPRLRTRAALACGRVADPLAVPDLSTLLGDPQAGGTAAWALGRIDGGEPALIACLSARCPAAPAAARALGARSSTSAAIAALAGALAAPDAVAAEAGTALGILARGGKESALAVAEGARGPLEAALTRPAVAVRAAAVYVLGRLPTAASGAAGSDLATSALAAALRDPDAGLRALAARGWGQGARPAALLSPLLADPDWRVRVEAARAMAHAAGGAPAIASALPAAAAALAGRPVADARFAHVLVALLESAAPAGVAARELPLPSTLQAPTRASIVAIRCAAAVARDRATASLRETPACGAGLEPEWRARKRAGQLAAALAGTASSGAAPAMRGAALAALGDPDGRVRAAAAAEVAGSLSRELVRLLADPDPYVVAAAASALAKDPALARGARADALRAAVRLAPARGKGAGDPAADALAALAELLGAAATPEEDAADPAPRLTLLSLSPTASPFLHQNLLAALRRWAVPPPSPPPPPRVPDEAAAGLPGKGPRPRLLSLLTSTGEIRVALHSADGEAPLTAAAVAALAGRGFYDGLTFHRVVPDFVAQGGDPRDDGDGGPGWALPDEHTPGRFLRGTLGIATNGPGTESGGSQIFLCHSPQPHLDGRYTAAGELEAGGDALDALQPGDEILSATVE
jgi:cyclophilin family peptidyl-prolyl cis-trans isomerase/HEAT repeat protein